MDKLLAVLCRSNVFLKKKENRRVMGAGWMVRGLEGDMKGEESGKEERGEKSSRGGTGDL